MVAVQRLVVVVAGRRPRRNSSWGDGVTCTWRLGVMHDVVAVRRGSDGRGGGGGDVAADEADYWPP